MTRNSLHIMKDVLFALVLREFLTRFGSRRMGAFWLLLEPMAHIALMMFIFTVVRAREVPGMEFPIFLLAGMIPFFLMRNIIMKLMDSVSANQALFAYPNIKIFDTYIARTLVECLISATVYCIFLFALGFWGGYDVSIAHPLEWLGYLIIGIAFSFGLGILFSVIVQVMPNAKSLIRIIFMPLYLISGIIFPLWIIPEQYLPWLLWNPFAHIISDIRQSVFVYYPDIPGVNTAYPLTCTLVILFVSIGLYRVRRYRLLTR